MSDYVKLSNIVVEDPSFVDAVDQVLPEESQLIRSGIVQDGVLGEDVPETTKTVTCPSWAEIADSTPGAADDEVISTEDKDLTPRGFSMVGDIATTLVRGKAFQMSDLAKIYAGAKGDPALFLARAVARYQSRQEQYALVAALNGVFGHNAAKGQTDIGAAGDLIYDITGRAVDAKYRGRNTIAWAKQKLGSSRGNLVAIACHSIFATELSTIDKAMWEPASESTGFIPRYCGLAVIEDDSLPYDPNTKTATAVLFGSGAFARQRLSIENPMEFTRKALASQSIVIRRWRMLLHPRGIKWIGTAAKETPSNAELATAGNWKQVYQTKQIRIVKMVANLRASEDSGALRVQIVSGDVET